MEFAVRLPSKKGENCIFLRDFNININILKSLTCPRAKKHFSFFSSESLDLFQGIIKRKLIGAIICFIIGIMGLIFLAVSSEIINEELLSYMSGFSSGIIVIGIITLIKYTRIMKNEQMSKKIERSM